MGEKGAGNPNEDSYYSERILLGTSQTPTKELARTFSNQTHYSEESLHIASVGTSLCLHLLGGVTPTWTLLQLLENARCLREAYMYF